MQVSSQVQVLTLQFKVKSICCKGQVKSYFLSNQVKSQLSHQVTPSRTQASFTQFFYSGTFITLFRHVGPMGYKNE